MPPELDASGLYESPESSSHLLISTYLSQKEKLERVRIKGQERIEFYAHAAADQNAGPTLADMLALVARDHYSGFADFPMAVRPVYDFLSELRLVTELPTLVAVDGWNHWHEMATSCHWRSKTPLHASNLLVPSLLADIHEYGSAMANGVML